MEVGLAAVELGAGRLKKGDAIDHAVGIALEAKVGDQLQAGDLLLTIHANDESRFAAAQDRLLAAYTWTESAVDLPPLVYRVIR
jgi:thymidine phosphorylase